MTLHAVLTRAGLEEAVSLIDQGLKVTLSYYALGSGSGYNPNKEMTSLRGREVFRSDFQNVTLIDEQTIGLEISLNRSVGNFTFGEIGVYTSNNTLFALIVMPYLVEKYKTGGADVGNAYELIVPIRFDSKSEIEAADININSIDTVIARAIEIAAPKLMPLVTTSDSNLYILKNQEKITSAFCYGVTGIWSFSNYSIFATTQVNNVAIINPYKQITVTCENSLFTDVNPGELMIQVTAGNRTSRLANVFEVEKLSDTTYRLKVDADTFVELDDQIQILINKDATARIYQTWYRTYPVTEEGKNRYVLPIDPQSIDNITVNIDGTIQQKSSYSLEGQILVFSEIDYPPLNSVIEVEIKIPYANSSDLNAGASQEATNFFRYKSLSEILANNILQYGIGGVNTVKEGDLLYTGSQMYRISSPSVVTDYATLGGVRFEEAGGNYSTIERARKGYTYDAYYLVVNGVLYQPYQITNPLPPAFNTADNRAWQLSESLSYQQEFLIQDNVQNEITLTITPIANTLQVFIDGLLKNKNEYVLQGDRVIFPNPIGNNKRVACYYRSNYI